VDQVGRGRPREALPLRLLLVVALIGAASLVSPTGASAASAAPETNAAGVPPAGFSDTVAISGLTQPTTVAFAGDGRVFVAEKSGLIKVFDSLADTSPTVFANLRTQVHNFWDRGLLGLALDPQFPTRPYVYALYTYDALPGGGAPQWGTVGGTSDGCPNPPGSTLDGCVVQARLSRLTASGNQMTGSEQVLVSGWCQQFPSHSIGTVTFGPDGALYAGAGDGASFNYVDYGQTKNPCGDPPAPAGTSLAPPTAQGGALRSQSVRRPAGQPVTLDGTIIRVDPNTGAGLPGNPFASHADQNARRIIAYGLRNPFRFDVRPGTQQLWVGDVGANTWEEIDRIADIDDGIAENFGWPCYEGSARQGGYDAADLASCESLYGAGQAGPFYQYNHNAKVVASDACATGSSSLSGVAFENGSNYPADYDGALFFADASRGCIWVMKRGGGVDPNPSQLSQFVGGAGQPVQVVTGPGGDIFYVDLEGGQLHRVVYNGANHPPTAVISASPTSGAAPLTVSFDGSGSSDLDPADSLSYAWDLDGDGQLDDSTAIAPSRTYTVAGAVTVRLRVADPSGASDTQSVTITVGASANSPPVPVIDTPASGLRWQVGDAISFSGHATDAQDGTLPPIRLSWSVVLNHCPSNCHAHPVQGYTGVATGTFPAPDHEYPSSLSLVLTATDSAGAQASTSLQLDPRTVDLTFATTPSGLQLGVGAASITAPTTRRVIVGSSNSVSAPSPQTFGGASYTFSFWSDGGARTHNVIAPATPRTYTAAFGRVGCPASPSFDYTMPTPTGPPAATSLPDGRVAFSALGSDGQYYLVATDIITDPPAAGPLECLGGAATDNPAVAAGTSFAALFVRTADNRLWERTITASSAGAWSPLPIGGASPSGPSAVVTSGDVVHLVMRGTNGAIYHATRRGTTWSAWENLGGVTLGTPAVAPWPGGKVAIFVRATNNGTYVKYGNTGSWTGWYGMARASLSSPTVASGYRAGRLDVFVVGTAGGLFQRAFANGAWTGWVHVDSTLPASARIAAAARSNRVIVYASAGGATTYKQYYGRWVGYHPAPYTCATCLPRARSTRTIG
jgi:glucose/arabinose dehydrogenase